MAGPLLLGIDLGTSAVKALIVDLDGSVVGRGLAEHSTDRPSPDRAEQDPDGWWAAAVRAVREAVAETASAGAPSSAIAGAAVDGQCHGGLLLGRSGRELRPLAPAIVWMDARTRAEVAALTEALGAAEIIAHLGGPLATGFLAPTLAWLAAHEPGLLASAAAIISPKDELRRRLTGEIATDPSDASAAGLLDLATRRWWPPILDALGIDESRLPELRDGPAPAGALSGAAAAALGLRAGIPVAIGAADTPTGIVGAGLVAPDAALASISTGGTLVVPARTPATDPTGIAHSFCGALPPTEATAGWFRQVATLAAGVGLRWLRDAVLTGAGTFEEMIALAAGEPPGAGGLLWLPHLAGERGPNATAATKGAFVGLTVRHGRGALIRAVMEGVVFSLRAAADALDAVAPLPDRIILAGGGARSDTWTQMAADILGRPVARLLAEEGAALGACVLAGAAAGLLDPAETAPRWARLRPPLEPSAASAAAYGASFEAWRAADAALRPYYRRAGADS